MIRMLGHLTLSQRSLRLSSFLLILFFFFPLCFIYFHHSIFHLTYPIFCLSYSTIGSLQSVFDLFLFWLIALFIIDWLVFISSRSLLNIFCIFSTLYPDYLSVSLCSFQDFGSFLPPLFWFLFQVDSLSPLFFFFLFFGLVVIYHVPLPAEYFSAFSSCLDCCVWGELSVCWKFMVLLCLDVPPCGWCWTSGLSRFPA